MISILLLLVIAGICGSVGNAIAGGTRSGCLISIALGFIGALLGSWLAARLGLPELFTLHLAGTSFPLIWSIMGATLFVAVVHLISRQSRS